MRIFPIITAVLVTAFLYGIVMERDALMAIARGESPKTALGLVDETVGETPEPSDEGAKVEVAAQADADAETAETTDAQADQQENARKPVRVVAINSTAREIDSAVILRGQTEASRSVQLRAETTGRVASDPIRKGASVTSDQLICAIDPGTRNATLAEAQARLAEARAAVPTSRARVDEAKARLNEAQISQNAAAKLSEDGFASTTRVASADAAVESAKAALAQAEAGLSSTQAAIQSAEAAVAAATREIDRTEIHAPFAGLLEEDTAELGSLLQNGGLCATIIQLDPIKLVGFVPETAVGRIELGAMAGARLAAGGGEVIGQVTFLSRSADPQTRTFRVEIAGPNPDLSIRDGQTAEIGIAAPGADAHLVPQSALTLNDSGNLGVRIVDDQSLARFVPVTLLRDTIEGVWIAGLPANAQVIIIGQEFVVDGVPVLASVQEPTQ
jgi:multidrug efflux system membrane fusion protein